MHQTIVRRLFTIRGVFGIVRLSGVPTISGRKLRQGLWPVLLIIAVIMTGGSCRPSHAESNGDSREERHDSNRERNQAPIKEHSQARTIGVVTYNVSLRSFLLDKRGPRIADMLSECNADVIALQEVTPEFFAILKHHPDIAARYTPYPADSRLIRGRLVTLSRLPVGHWQYHALPGRMGRVAQHLTFSTASGDVDFFNLHLESYLQDGPIRARQLLTLHGKYSEPAIITGDLNFGDGPEAAREHAAIPPGFQDAWRILEGDSPGYTWDQERNPLALRFRFEGEVSRRLDRILFRASDWLVASVDLIGTQPEFEMDGERIPPSDHYGVHAVFTYESSAVSVNNPDQTR
ncbi:MAG: endonuclease/exonuclease/phosphatase family protein [Leptospiraceae bacterium]|nr:endonuclease/exonuclease/phosphatase family protein [Leptospiraceae bacterium]